ncbi:MAG: histidinol-phosphate transaminase [Planctomycetes bacterium]|nr:histidinol-phosphate transaminase [Planctomycetota bacterium]
MSFFRPEIDAMTAYVPGEQPSAGEKVIKLNTNENPYPPSPAAMAAVRRLDGDMLRRYPSPTAEVLRRAAAEALGVPAEWILPGNGSDDVLAMIFRACAGPGRKVAYPVPTYTLYRTLAEMYGAEAVEVPYDDEYRLPADGLAEAQAAVTFLVHPNAPSGTPAPPEAIERLAGQLDGLLVIDEAYADFADYDLLELARGRDNVIVVRTLSKGYSLAGMRIGFGVARPAILDGLMKVKDSYNVDAVAAAAAAAALVDQDYHARCVEKVRASRARLAAELEGMGFRVWPSQANFLRCRPPAGRAETLYQTLKRRGILVRYFKQPRLADKLRITVGTDEQNDALLRAVADILAGR